MRRAGGWPEVRREGRQWRRSGQGEAYGKRLATTGGLTLTTIGGGREVRFLEVGKALVERLGRAAPEDLPSADEEAALREA